MHPVARFAGVMLAVLLLCWTAGLGQAPSTFSYQGRLVLASGQPVINTTPVIFSLYELESGGNPIWSETQSITPDEIGVFSVELGASSPLPLNLMDGRRLWLGIRVGGDDEMAPRQLLTSVPYALKVASIASNAVTTAAIANNAVTSIKIASNTIVASDMRDEPGVAATTLTSDKYLDLQGDTTSLVSATISCPLAGYVLAIATAQVTLIHNTGVTSYGRFGISDNPDAFVENTDVGILVSQAAPTGNYIQGLTTHAVFPVTSGENTFHLLGSLAPPASSTIITSAHKISLVYLPTDYGPITSANSPGDDIVDSGAESDGLAVPGSIPTLSHAELMNEIERIEAEFGQRIMTLRRQLITPPKE